MGHSTRHEHKLEQLAAHESLFVFSQRFDGCGIFQLTGLHPTTGPTTTDLPVQCSATRRKGEANMRMHLSAHVQVWLGEDGNRTSSRQLEPSTV